MCHNISIKRISDIFSHIKKEYWDTEEKLLKCKSFEHLKPKFIIIHLCTHIST